MFARIDPTKLLITATEERQGLQFLHCTDRCSQLKVTLKRNVADTKRTIQEFEVLKRAHTVASGVVEPYQLVTMNGEVYIAMEAVHKTLQSALTIRRRHSLEAEEELLHKLLKLLATVHSLHSAHIAHGGITSHTIWDHSSVLKLGGFESARVVEITEMQSALREDCRMVGVVLAEALTNTFGLCSRRTEECLQRLDRPYVSDQCLYLLPVAEQLLTANHNFTIARALDYFKVVKLHPLSNLPTMQAKRCAVCCKRCTTLTTYPCPSQHCSCSQCFDSRALSISKRVFDESDFRCILCEDTVIPALAFLSLVTDERVKDQLERAISAAL